MASPKSLAAVVVLAVLTMSLMSCRAMDLHDIDGTHYQNEKRRFYSPEATAVVKVISHAYGWESGDLEGSCQEAPTESVFESLPSLGKIQEERVLVDTILIDPAGLFPTDRWVLTPEGEELLSQLIKRIETYPEVYNVTVEGHADVRASIEHNQLLSENRAEAVAKSLRAVVDPDIVHTRGFSELKPVDTETASERLAENRRVTVTIVVATDDQPKRVFPQDNTLCHSVSDNDGDIADIDPVEKLKTRLTQSLLKPYGDRPPLSAGDRIRIVIPEGEELSGVYEVGLGGALEIPFAGLIPVQGLNTRTLETIVHDRLIEEQIFQPGMLRVSMTVQEWAPADVLVSGATFDPGRVTVNRQKTEYRSFKQTQLSGDFAKDRLLSAALFAAGGIRPDADIGHIQLIRNGTVKMIDLRGLFDGSYPTDVPLAAGDQIVVPSSGVFQRELVGRSQITPPGVRVFISNLSVPATDNSKAAVNSSSTSMPYGTRFLQGLISGNCVGGTQLTNASRRAVLVSQNPITERTEVIERSIQQLISDPERDEVNPFLMPNDGIACYDSGVTNFRDVTKTLTEFLTPVLDLRRF